MEGVECDVICIGRFYDFLEKRKGRWGLVWRRLTYEKDQIAPVDPAKAPKLDPKLLAHSLWATATSPICRPRSATR